VIKRRRIWAGAILLLLLILFVVLTRGPETSTPNQPGTFSFAVLGDAPYDIREEIQYRLVLNALNSLALMSITQKALQRLNSRDNAKNDHFKRLRDFRRRKSARKSLAVFARQTSRDQQVGTFSLAADKRNNGCCRIARRKNDLWVGIVTDEPTRKPCEVVLGTHTRAIL
jgi:hypothetical protein